MIRIGEKNISIAYYGSKAISAIYQGALLVWTAIRSCFGSGMWSGEKPWIGTDAWKSK
jgi:hypothetical protein